LVFVGNFQGRLPFVGHIRAACCVAGRDVQIKNQASQATTGT
jgi:hypothetical protein